MYTRIDEVADKVFNILDTASASLGIKYVGYGEEKALPEYPAIVIVPAATTREIHATRQFLNSFNLELYVYHARLTVKRSIRTKEDLELVTSIVDKLHEYKTLDNNIIFGMVDSENPGVLATQKGDAVVGTRITWAGSALEPFDMP